MGYVGNQTTNAFTSMDKQDITGNGGTSYTLSHAVANAQEIEVFVNNVRQEPAVAYTATGTTLTMTGAVASTDDFYVVYQGKAVQTVVPPDASVSTAKIANGAVTDAKIDTMAASKLTGALPAISGAALTGVGSNIKEQLVMLCDGGSYTVPSGTYTAQSVNAGGGTSSTHSNLSGSVITYTPPAGTTAVVYEFSFAISPKDTSEHNILHAKLFIAGTEVTDSRCNFAARDNFEMLCNFRYVIPIGGTASTATGRQSSWTSGKELKMQVRRYGTNNEPRIHETRYWDGAPTSVFRRPTLTITALG